MIQSTFDVMERIRGVTLSRGDRRIVESAARGAELTVDLLCLAGAATWRAALEYPYRRSLELLQWTKAGAIKILEWRRAERC